MTSSAEERAQIMIADGSIGDHAKKTEKEDGESSFLVCFGCRAAKIRAEMKEQQE